MTLHRAGRSSPLSLLALVLVGGAVAVLLDHRASPRPSGDDCPRGVDGRCVEAPAGAAGQEEVAPAPPPHLDAATACRDAAYLCADADGAGLLRVQRWRDFQGTMVVHVPLPDLDDPAQAQRLQRAATAGIRLWNGQPFPILVDERGTRPARVEVKWVRSLTGTRIGVAHVVWSSRDGLSVQSIELVTQSPFDGTDVDPDAVRLTAMHEMGHALGLPHSDDPHDVMYPKNTARNLSARDYLAVEALYRLPDGAIIDP